MRNKNTRKGFTTVELVIVIAVIAILATVLIPTFSNMIASANLSVDKQNVRNMNVCLATYSITDGNPSDFGKVKEELKYYGYGKEDNFKTKSEGFTISWYTDDRGTSDKTDDISVILLLDAAGKVVYPEEYVDDPTIQAGNIRMCFDLSLPAALVDIDESPDKLDDFDPDDIGLEEVQLAEKYTFIPAQPDANTAYGNWFADFYVSFKNKDGSTLEGDKYDELVGLMIGGFYHGWSLGPYKDDLNDNVETWLILELTDADAVTLKTKGEIPLVATMLDPENPQTYQYSMVLSKIKYTDDEGKDCYEFKCGVIDEENDAFKDVIMSVELRLTEANADGSSVENAEVKVVGMYEYTFK